MLDFPDESDYTYIKQWLKEATGRRDISLGRKELGYESLGNY